MLHHWDKKKSPLNPLPSGLCIMRLSTLCCRNPNYSQPFVSSEDCVTLSFLVVLSQPQIFSLHAQTSTQLNTQGEPSQNLQSCLFMQLSLQHLSLHMALSSPFSCLLFVPYSTSAGQLVLLNSQLSLLNWGSLLDSLWVLPCCAVSWKLSSGNMLRWSMHLLVCISGVIALSWNFCVINVLSKCFSSDRGYFKFQLFHADQKPIYVIPILTARRYYYIHFYK